MQEVKTIIADAKDYQKNEKWIEALDLWNEVILRRPKNQVAIHQSGILYLNLYKYADALDRFILEKKLWPASVSGYRGVARVFQEKKEWEKALDVWIEILNKFPEHVPAYERVVSLYLKAGQCEEAQKISESLVYKYPESPIGYEWLGQTLLRRKHFSESIESFQAAISFGPGSMSSIKGLADAYLGMQDLKLAEKFYEKAMLAFPQSPGGYVGLSRILLLRNNYIQGIAFVKDAIRQFPDCLQLYLLKIQFYRKQQKHGNCWKIIKEVETRFPEDGQVLISKARQYVAQNDFSMAEKIYKQLITQESLRKKIYLEYINCLTCLGRTEETRERLIALVGDEYYTQNPAYYNACARAFDENNLLEAGSLLALISSRSSSRLLVTKYLSSLEWFGRIDDALQFVESLCARGSELDDPQILMECLFQKQRLTNLNMLIHRKKKKLNKYFYQQLQILRNDICSAVSEYSIEKSFLKDHFHYMDDMLKEIETTCRHSYLNTGFIPTEAFDISMFIVRCIKDSKPISLVRLGDGEGHFLEYPNEFKNYQDNDQSFIQNVWWGRLVFVDSSAPVVKRFIQAISNADIIGITDHHRILARSNIIDKFSLNKPLVRGTISVNHYIWSKMKSHEYKNKIITSSVIHQDLQAWGLYDQIFRYAKKCSVITCHENISDNLKERFGLSVRKTYLIPPESQWGDMFGYDSEENTHFPRRYYELCDEIEVGYQGELFLVGAGFLGKIYCDIIKKRGGIALDLGSKLDYWASFDTRPGMFTMDDAERVLIWDG